MSTAINITVDDGGLPARNRQQVAANRQAFVQNVAAEKSTALGVDQRNQDRIAQGRDPATGALLVPPTSTGAPGSSGGNIPRLNQQPAANRQLDKEETAFYFFKPDAGPDSIGTWQARGNGIVLPAELYSTLNVVNTNIHEGKFFLYYTGDAVGGNMGLFLFDGTTSASVGGSIAGTAERSLKPNVAAKKIIVELSLQSPVAGDGGPTGSSGASTSVTAGFLNVNAANGSTGESFVEASGLGGSVLLPAGPLSLTKVKAILSKNSLQVPIYVNDAEDPTIMAINPELRDNALLSSACSVSVDMGAGTGKQNFTDPWGSAPTGNPRAKDIRITWYL